MRIRVRFVGAVRLRAARWCGGGGLDCGDDGLGDGLGDDGLGDGLGGDTDGGGLGDTDGGGGDTDGGGGDTDGGRGGGGDTDGGGTGDGNGGGGPGGGGGGYGDSSKVIVKGAGGGDRRTLRIAHVALPTAVRLSRPGGGGVRNRARVVRLVSVLDALCWFDQRIPPETETDIATTTRTQTMDPQQTREPPVHSNRPGSRTSSVDDAGDPWPLWLRRW